MFLLLNVCIATHATYNYKNKWSKLALSDIREILKGAMHHIYKSYMYTS